MGPSVKFVSRINGSFSKKHQTGGWGGRGRFGKSPDFSAFFFVKPSLNLFYQIIVMFQQIFPSPILPSNLFTQNLFTKIYPHIKFSFYIS